MTARRLSKIKSVVSHRQQGIIVLEDIHDPHNAMAVVRTAEAFGFQQVYFIFEQEKSFNPKKIGKSSSSSGNKWLDYKIFKSTISCYHELHLQGYQIYATTLNDQSASLFKTKFIQPKTAIVFGSEHRGLSPSAIQLADHQVYIPMRGFVQSLNLSVAAAIFLYELTRQRQLSKKFLLTITEQKSLLARFKLK